MCVFILVKMYKVDPRIRYKMKWITVNPENERKIVNSFRKNKIPVLNIGKKVSFFINSNLKSNHLALEVENYLNDLFPQKAKFIEIFGINTLVIHNLGILFEPSLELNPTFFIKEQSKNIFIILLWEDYFQKPGYFFWDSNYQDIGFDFSDINIQNMESFNEIQ